MYNFPKPSELPKPSINKQKVQFKLQQISSEVREASSLSKNSIIVSLYDELNSLEIEQVIKIITEAGYTVRCMGCYEISWSN